VTETASGIIDDMKATIQKVRDLLASTLAEEEKFAAW
jgi:hypothetical protein